MSELVVPALQAVSTAGDAYPPLRSVASSALWISRNVKVHILDSLDKHAVLILFGQTNKHAKAEWTAFANYIQQGVACVIVVASKDSSTVSPSLEAHLSALETYALFFWAWEHYTISFLLS
jgi:hypothetical protein